MPRHCTDKVRKPSCTKRTKSAKTATPLSSASPIATAFPAATAAKDSAGRTLGSISKTQPGDLAELKRGVTAWFNGEVMAPSTATAVAAAAGKGGDHLLKGQFPTAHLARGIIDAAEAPSLVDSNGGNSAFTRHSSVHDDTGVNADLSEIVFRISTDKFTPLGCSTFSGSETGKGLGVQNR